MDELMVRLTKASELRLHLGEMSAQELRTAQAAVRYALSQVDTHRPNATHLGGPAVAGFVLDPVTTGQEKG